MSAIEGFCDVRTEPADLNKALIGVGPLQLPRNT